MVAVTNRNWSNSLYGTKVLVRIIIWHIQIDLVVKSLKKQATVTVFPIGIHWKSEL